VETAMGESLSAFAAASLQGGEDEPETPL